MKMFVKKIEIKEMLLLRAPTAKVTFMAPIEGAPRDEPGDLPITYTTMLLPLPFSKTIYVGQQVEITIEPISDTPLE